MVVTSDQDATRNRIEELLRLQVEVEILEIASREGAKADKARSKRFREIGKRIDELEKENRAAITAHRISL